MRIFAQDQASGGLGKKTIYGWTQIIIDTNIIPRQEPNRERWAEGRVVEPAQKWPCHCQDLSPDMVSIISLFKITY